MKISTTLVKRVSVLASVVFVTILTGCAGPKFTVDDGSEVDEKLLSSIRLYGKAHQAVRPAIIKTAELKDKDCDKQWELPFAVADSYDLPKMDRIAWVRGAGVDERLTVISVASDSVGLTVGDKLDKVDGYHRDNTEKMRERLIEARDDGDPFDVITSGGKKIRITPVKVCRGHFEIADPYKPDVQEYHWLQARHPLSVFNHELTRDEALWMVLWTQGMSEEVGARMKTYHYGMRFVKTALTVASIASGIGAVANAAQAAAANAAAIEAGKQAAQAAGEAVARYAAEQAMESVRNRAIAVAQEALKAQAQDVALDTMKTSVLFRSSLSGISWVAGTGFYMADKWAFDRMAKLGADPVAGFSVHFKLASHALAANAFVFDEERADLMMKFAEANGMSDMAKHAMSGSFGSDQANGDVIAMQDTEVRQLDVTAEKIAAIAVELPVTTLLPAASHDAQIPMSANALMATH